MSANVIIIFNRNFFFHWCFVYHACPIFIFSLIHYLKYIVFLTGKNTTSAQEKSETTIDKQEDDKPNDDVGNRIKATSEESKITDTVPSDGDRDNKQLTSQVSGTEQDKCTPAEKEKIKKRVSGRSMAALGLNDSADPASRACIILWSDSPRH